MTRRKLASTAPKTKTRWKKSQPPTVTLATGVGEYTLLEMEKSRSHGLKALNDSPFKLQVVGEKVLVEEELLQPTPDKASGLTQDVCDAIASGKLVLAETSEYALLKYPYKGTVLSVGERCKYTKVGDRVQFAQFGVQRFQFEGKQFLIMHEADIHGFYELPS